MNCIHAPGLEALVEPFTEDEFLARYFGIRSVRLSPRSSLLSLIIPNPDVRQKIASCNSTNIMGAPVKLLDNGHTVEVHGPEKIHRPLADFLLRIERSFEATTEATLIVRKRESATTATYGEKLILQLAGNTLVTIDRDDRAEPLLAPKQTVILEAGSCMYIPASRQYWLSCFGRENWQLAIGISQPTGADLIRWISEVLAQQSVFRQTIPRFSDPAVQYKFLNGVRDAVSDLIQAPNILVRFREFLNKTAGPRPEMQAISDVHTLVPGVIYFTSRRAIDIVRVSARQIGFTLHSMKLVFDERFADPLFLLAHETPMHTSVFCSKLLNRFSIAELTNMLNLLQSIGVVEVREEGN
jgi:hypothetical protein